MMRNLLLFFCCLLTVSVVDAQIFKEDFDGNGPGISAWITLDLDGLPRDPKVNFITNGWNRIDRNGANGNFGGPAGNYAVISTSWYTPPGTSNDWLISPLIDLANSTTPNLTFDIKAQDPEYRDGYLLKLSPTGGSDVADFTVTLDESTGASSEWTKLHFDLTPYKDNKIRFALINNSTDLFMLLADNFLVSNDVYVPSYCESLNFTSKVEPITRVKLNNIDKTTPPTNTVSHIMYLDNVVDLVPGETYDIVLEGFTAGNFINSFVVFFDWDQDLKFTSENEAIQVMETLENSTGVDGKQVIQSFTVPENAIPGETRMRIKKIFGTSNLLNSCLGAAFGQAQDFTVNVGQPLSYCEPYLDCSDGDKITHVKFAGIDNASTCNTTTGYSDFTNLPPAVVEKGTIVPIEVTVGNGFHSESVSVWIDYNKNGIFDEDEYTFIGTGSGSTVLGSINIPLEVADGTYRMRVRNVAATEVLTGPDLACDSSVSFGETEDYLVKVIKPIPPVLPVCNQGVTSNELENALFWGGTLNQRLAIDVLVNKNEEMKISSVDVNHASDATNFTLLFYAADSAGLVGELLFATDTNITSKTAIGTNFSRTFYTSSLDLITPITLSSINGLDTYYWMEIVTDAEAWESRSSEPFGQLGVYLNDNTDDEWLVGSNEYIYAIKGDCSVLSLQEIQKANFSYYPNPVTDLLIIDALKSIGKIEVFNLEGRQILNLTASKVSTNKTTVNMSRLPKGIYVVRTEIDGQIKTFKIIKK